MSVQVAGFGILDHVDWFGERGQIIALVTTPSAVVAFEDGRRITIGLNVLDHAQIGPVEKCRDCGREEWGHSWLDHRK